MKTFADVERFVTKSDLDELKASRLKSELYKDGTIYVKKEREIIERYSHVKSPLSLDFFNSKFFVVLVVFVIFVYLGRLF